MLSFTSIFCSVTLNFVTKRRVLFEQPFSISWFYSGLSSFHNKTIYLILNLYSASNLSCLSFRFLTLRIALFLVFLAFSFLVSKNSLFFKSTNIPDFLTFFLKIFSAVSTSPFLTVTCLAPSLGHTFCLGLCGLLNLEL